MDGIIKVDPQKLISTADEFNGTGGQLKGITDQMISVVDSLKPVYEGEAATTYNTKFHQLQSDMDKMYRMIQEHVKDLNEMAQQYISVENINIDSGNALAGDVIS